MYELPFSRERLTDLADKTLDLSEQVALYDPNSYKYIRTDHLLGGLVLSDRENPGIISTLLRVCSLGYDEILEKLKLEELNNPLYGGETFLANRTKDVLNGANSMAGLDLIGRAHIWFGLMKDEEGLARQALADLTDLTEAREEKIRRLVEKAFENGFFD